MGIFDYFRGASTPAETKAPGDVTTTTGSAGPAYDPAADRMNWSSAASVPYAGQGRGLFGGFFPSETGVPVSNLTSLSSSAVYACVRALSEDIGKLPLRIQKLEDKNYKNLDKHPLVDLIQKPNRFQTHFEFWKNMVWSHQLTGNAYAYLRRNRQGRVVEMVYLNPNNVNLLFTEKGKVYYGFTHKMLRNGSYITCAPEDMIHAKGMSIDGGFKGISPIQVLQTVVGLDLATRSHAAAFYRQGTNLSGVITHANRLSEVAMNNLRNGWEAAFGGTRNAHRVVVLQEGADFKPVSMTAADAQLIEARKMNSREIASLFRVPLHKIGDLEKASFANIEDQNQSYIDDALMSIAKPFEEALESRLLFEAERLDHQVRFDFSELLRGNSLQRAQRNQILRSNGVLSANEWRAQEGWSAVDGGDVYETYQNLAGKGIPESMAGGAGAGASSDASPKDNSPKEPTG